ncbi:hypothetical protein GMA13_09995 [Ruminococcus sp. zg-924]|nr:hypothetical protein [Ruminococcus sp. zg-924]MCQ4115684.1 hypothetical protein [Ruminococcus sp. zg-921]
MYFAKADFYNIIRSIGGKWNDSKERPLVCLFKLDEFDNIYWAIPMGNWNHRDAEAKKRINIYINRDDKDIASCFYHIGRTTTKSIFFISDVIPITDKYIERQYLGYDRNAYIIKNPNLLSELERKLKRIIFFEDKNKNYFRQHITDIKNYLIEEQNK